MNLLQKPGVLPHVGSQLLHDPVDLPVVQGLGHLLFKQQAVEHGVKAPEGRHGLLRLHLGVVGGGGDVLIFPQLLGEGPEGGPADGGVFLVLVVVLEQGVAQGILLPFRLEGRELHVRQLRHVVDLVGGVDGLGQGRQGALRLGMEQMGLVPKHILQIVLVGRGLVDGLLQHVLRLLVDFRLNEAQVAGYL